MKNENDPFIQKWERAREKGLLNHLLNTGSSFGILLFVVLTAYNYFMSDTTFETTYDFLIQLVICIVFGGGFYALITWFLNEYLYKKKTGQK